MMKKVVALSLAFLLLLPGFASAATYFAGDSDPALIMVYGSYNWSREGHWDLRNQPSIPDTAVVQSVRLAYSLDHNSGMTYDQTNVALFNTGSSTGYYLESGLYYNVFVGQSVKQDWYTQFWVENSLIGGTGYITANLAIRWTDPASGTSGVTTLHPDGTATTAAAPVAKPSDVVQNR